MNSVLCVNETWHALLRERERSGQATRKVLRLSINITGNMLPNVVICKSMQRHLSASKSHHFAASHRRLVGTDFLQRCLEMSSKLTTTQLPHFPQLCFSKIASKDLSSCQSSSVELYRGSLDGGRG